MDVGLSVLGLAGQVRERVDESSSLDVDQESVVIKEIGSQDSVLYISDDKWSGDIPA